jgi:hypothetical protein
MRMSFANRQEKRSNAQTWVGYATLPQITPADNCTTAPQIAPLLPRINKIISHESLLHCLFSRTIGC